MKLKIYIIIFLFFSLIGYSQKSKKITCDSIHKGIKDRRLYEKIGEKEIFIPNFHKYEIYKITTGKRKSSYYVTKKVMKRIKKVIKKQKCEGIKIEEIEKKSETNIKIIRD